MNSVTPPIRPLTVGDVVSTGFRLYRSNFRSYFILALRSTLWLVAPLIAWTVWGFLIAVFSSIASSSGNQGVLVLLGIGSFILLIIQTFRWIYRSVLNMALIARLAYGEFISQPETQDAAYQALRPRSRQIFVTFWYTGIILFFINFGLSIFNIPLTAIFAGIFQGPTLAPIAALIANLITLSVYVWIAARFFAVELPLILESNLTATQSISRIWKLSHGSALRILIITTIAFLVTIPLYAVSSVPPILGIVAAIPAFNGGAEAIQAATVTRILPGLFLGFLLFLALNMMVMGFWQSIKAIVYYDLHSRREGGDIQLSHRRSSTRSSADRSADFGRINHDTPYEQEYTFGNDVPDLDSASRESLDPIEPPESITSHGESHWESQQYSSDFTAEKSYTQTLIDRSISDDAKRISGQLLEQADCHRLSSSDWSELQQYLQCREDLEPTLKAEQSLNLARHLRETIGLRQLPQKMTGDTFLEALYWAIVSANLQP